jgi:hypothetical protein
LCQPAAFIQAAVKGSKKIIVPPLKHTVNYCTSFSANERIVSWQTKGVVQLHFCYYKTSGIPGK